MDTQEPDISSEIMRQFAQSLVRIIQYGQRDMNVARAAQGQSLAPGSSFGPPTTTEQHQADQPITQPQRQPPSKDTTWAEYYGVPSKPNDEMAALRERAVQEAARRQREMVAKLAAQDAATLAGPDPFAAEPPKPTPENLDVGQSMTRDGTRWTRTDEQSWTFAPPPAPIEPTPPPTPPPAVVRTPTVPNASDTWGNWQDTQVDTATTTGTDNTQPNATQIGADLRTQLNRMNDNMGKLFDEITKSIIKINQRLEQIEASFESRECV
jgi:hypothetical protein